MSKNLKQALIGVLIGGFFLYITLKNKPLGEMFDSVFETDLSWVLLSGLFLLLTFFLRGMRWKLMLENLGYKIKTKNILYSITLGYFVNSFTPKLGEVSRCTSLLRSSNVPISKNLGTVVIERVYDLLVLVIGLVFIGLIEADRLGLLVIGAVSGVKMLILSNIYILVSFILVSIIGVIITIKLSGRFEIIKKLKGFMSEMLFSILGSLKMKRYILFLLYTVLIWTVLILMNYAFIKSFPQTESLGVYFAILVLFVGGIGWALPSPGGIGTTHFVILQLFITFNLSEESGIAFGVLSNGVTFIYTLLFGIIAIAIMSYNNYKKKRIEN